MQFYTDAELGPKQSTTPEGYLVCRDVVVARTGQQLYHETELLDVRGNGDGLVSVDRPDDEVFHPQAIASLAGKPICDDHPVDDIGPDNWGEYAIGFVSNPRRGSGENSDAVIADLVFTTRRGIDLVRNGKRAVSVGYNAAYENIRPGFARQRDIRANHLSLVDEARCGARCAIGDRAMSKPKRVFWTRDASPGGREIPTERRSANSELVKAAKVRDELRRSQAPVQLQALKRAAGG